MAEPRAQSGRHAGRQLVLLGLWIALLIVLLAMGVAGLGPGSPPPPSVPPSGAVSATVVAAPVGAADVAAVELQRRELPSERVAAPTGPTNAAQCRLRLQGGQQTWRQGRFLGDCAVAAADGQRIAALRGTADTRPLSFRLPVACARVRFLADGFVPIEREVPAMAEGVVDFGDVVLLPDAAVRVRVTGVSAKSGGKVALTVTGDSYQYSASMVAEPCESGVLLPAPSGRMLVVRAQGGDDAGLAFAARLPELTLAAGETRDCAVDVAALRATRIRVVGPSPELLSQLRVRWHSNDAVVFGGTFALDGDGRAVLRGVDPQQVGFGIDQVFEGGGLVPTDRVGAAATEALDAEYYLRPETRLVGLRVRAADGGWLPLASAPGDDRLHPRRLCVLPTAQLEAKPEVCVATADLGTLRWPLRAIVWHDELGTLDVATAVRGNSLVVTPTGDVPAESHRFRLLLQRPDGTVATLRRDRADFRTGDLVPGTYQLRWQIGDEPGPVIDASLAIAAGQRAALQVPWPTFAMWEGTVTNWRAIPVGDRFLCVRFGSWQRFYEGAQPPIDDAGHFRLPLPADSQGPADRVEFRRGTQGMSGRIVAVDVPGHRVMVEHPAVRFVELHVVPRGAGSWSLLLYAEGQDGLPWANLNQTVPSRVLVPDGMVLHGALSEAGPDGAPSEAVTAFATIDGSRPEMTVQAGGGHWCAVGLRRTGVKLQACLLDPRGRPGGDYFWLEQPGDGRIWVPDGATGLQVTLDPGGDQRFEPARTEIAIE